MKNTVIWAVLAAVLFGAVGFYGGVTYQKTQAPSGFAGRAGGFGGGGFGGSNSSGAGFRNSANVATGTVIAQDAQSITVKTSDGGSKTVFLSSTTHVSKQQVLTAADVKIGDQVAAFGQAGNGGITAMSVQIVPPGGSFSFGGGGRGGFGGGGAGGGNGGGSSSSGQ
ncbi:MAG: hypothetical protein P4L93_08115 [Coriobacteriia bacterium]|nr:hypothetical protein [Coriobacteriia bacterium]